MRSKKSRSGKNGAAEILCINPKTHESTGHPEKKEECLIYQEAPDISEVGTFQSIIPPSQYSLKFQ